jgi:uncharacterized membrane protein YraQ (UPF0718 family)
MNAEVKRTNRAGRWLGALIFAVGVVMLVGVFVVAAAAFAEIPIALAKGGSGSGLGHALAVTGARAAFLLVMAYVSSLLASKGLDLYQAARVQSEE